METEIPIATNLKTLMEILEDEFARNKTIEGNVARMTKIMETYHTSAQDWKEYALFDPSKYTRNLVDDGNGKYNLIIQCWGPGQESIIQDHSNGHCIFKMLHGNLVESVYEIPTGQQNYDLPLKLKKEESYQVNTVGYASNRVGLHKLCNKSSIPAVSIHLYSPIVNDVQSYSPKTSRSRPMPKLNLHSKYGELTHPSAKRFRISSNLTMHNNYYTAAAPSVVPPVVGSRIKRPSLVGSNI